MYLQLYSMENEFQSIYLNRTHSSIITTKCNANKDYAGTK